MNMTFRASSYLVTKEMSIVEESVTGAYLDPKNAFWWCKVILNLPGMDHYDSSRIWIFKVRKGGTLAADLFFYIDDGRPTTPFVWERWCTSKKICSTLIWYGLQDAGRKITETSQSPGEWDSTMVKTIDGKVFLLVSQKK